MNNNNWNNWKNWREVLSWAKTNGFKELARRLQLNNDCWMSSGEFGRDQVAIIDALRFTESEDECLEVAREIDLESASYMRF